MLVAGVSEGSAGRVQVWVTVTALTALNQVVLPRPKLASEQFAASILSGASLRLRGFPPSITYPI